jgi:LPS export ABC transporter protein LptC
MKLRPLLLWGAIFFSGIVFGFIVKEYVSQSEPEKPARAEKQTLEDSPLVSSTEISAEDILLEQGSEGALDWKLQARKAAYDQDKGLVVVERPQLTAYFGDDRQEVYVRADAGEVDQQNDNLTLYDNVDGRFGMFTVQAKNFDYVGAIDKVVIKGGVSVARPDLEVNATAVEIDLLSRQMVAAGGVEAVVSTSAVGSDGTSEPDEQAEQ